MTRFEFIEALKQALTGLPPEVITKTVAEYERRIIEASAAGQSEDEILAGLGDPQKIADDLREGLAPKVPAVVVPAPAAPAPKEPINFVRAFFSFIGLMLFNLFLVVPATVYFALLFAGYIVSLAFFGGGIAMTAGAISGVNQIVLNEPFHHIHVHRSADERDTHSIVTNGNGEHTVVNIGENGIHVETNADAHLVSASTKVKDAMSGKAASASASASASAAASVASANTAASASTAAKPASTDAKEHTVVDIGPNGVTIDSKDGAHAGDGSGKIYLHDHDGDEEDGDDNVNIDMPGLHFHNGDFDSDESVFSLGTDFISASRPVQVGVGIGVILGGIIAFLLCLVITRYTLLGLYRLAQMEFAVLRGA